MTIQVTKQNYTQEVSNATHPVLIDFYADWCGPCQMLKPVIEDISKTATHTKVVKINIDQEPELATQFQVMSIPTLIYLKDGKIVGNMVGYHPKNQILSMIGEL